jgi:RNA polymerase sigma factor (sigma-70 family)
VSAQDPGLNDFLTAATRERLLTPREEQELGAAVRAGDEPRRRIESINKTIDETTVVASLYDVDKTAELAELRRDLAREERLLAASQDARNRLVSHNIRLAVKAANGWAGNGVTLDDLVQEAILGLHYAANKFDPARRFRFSTYATPWINRQLWNAVHGSGPIKHTDDVLIRIVKVRRKLREKPDSTVAELALAAGCTESEAAIAASLATGPASLDAELMERGEGTEGRQWYDLIASSDGTISDEEISAGLRNAISSLGPDDSPEMCAVVLRFGCGCTPGEVADQISSRFGIDRREASRISNRAAKRFRSAMARERAAGTLPIEPSPVVCVRKEPRKKPENQLEPEGMIELTC